MCTNSAGWVVQVKFRSAPTVPWQRVSPLYATKDIASNAKRQYDSISAGEEYRVYEHLIGEE